MSTVTKPIALDESFNTTEATPRNTADVLAEELAGIATALGTSNTLAGLSDVNINSSTLADGQSIVYDQATGLFVNGGVKVWQGTQAQYDLIATPDPEVIYFITDSSASSVDLGDLADVTISSGVHAGDVIARTSDNTGWENKTLSIPTNSDFALSGLSDTDITTPTANQVLAYDGDNWVNTTPPKEVKYFDLTIASTTADSGISPFSYYGRNTKTDSTINNILSATVIDTQFNNPSITALYSISGNIYDFIVYSARSGNVKIRVCYN